MARGWVGIFFVGFHFPEGLVSVTPRLPVPWPAKSYVTTWQPALEAEKLQEQMWDTDAVEWKPSRHKGKAFFFFFFLGYIVT